MHTSGRKISVEAPLQELLEILGFPKNKLQMWVLFFLFSWIVTLTSKFSMKKLVLGSWGILGVETAVKLRNAKNRFFGFFKLGIGDDILGRPEKQAVKGHVIVDTWKTIKNISITQTLRLNPWQSCNHENNRKWAVTIRNLTFVVDSPLIECGSSQINSCPSIRLSVTLSHSAFKDTFTYLHILIDLNSVKFSKTCRPKRIVSSV